VLSVPDGSADDLGSNHAGADPTPHITIADSPSHNPEPNPQADHQVADSFTCRQHVLRDLADWLLPNRFERVWEFRGWSRGVSRAMHVALLGVAGVLWR